MNCLQTKLNESVADDSLLRLGEFGLHVNIPSDAVMNTRVLAVYNSTTTGGVRIVGDGYFTDSTGETNLGKTASYTGAAQVLYISPGEYDIFVGEKYTLISFSVGSNNKKNRKLLSKGSMEFTSSMTSIECTYFCNADSTPLDLAKVGTESLRRLTLYNDDNSATLTFKLNDLKNIDNFVQLQCPSQLASGNIALLENNSSMEIISAGSCNFEGDIVNLGQMISCTQINLRNNSGIYGTVESLLSALSSNGKTSGTLTLYLQGTQCTYNGSAVTESIAVTFPLQ